MEYGPIDVVKRRTIPIKSGVYLSGVINSTGNFVKEFPYSHVGYQETNTHTNVLWLSYKRLLRHPNLRKSDRERLRRIMERQDAGSGFYTSSTYYSDNSVRVRGSKGTSTQYVYDGPLFAHAVNSTPTSSHWPSLSVVDWNTVLRNGATAIARVQPLKPAANVAQFIGELREDLPSVPLMALRDRSGYFRSLGSEYLNVEFGWLPFIGDIQKQVAAMRNRNAIIAQLLRDSGRPVKRSYSFPSVRDQEVVQLGLSLPNPASPFPAVFPSNQTAKTLTKVTGRNDWFVGKFMYHLPEKDSLLSDIERYEMMANRLLGTRVTPAVLWELAPWSWLADWFGNFGDVLNNFVNLHQDSLVMTYGYSMSTIYKENIYNLAGSPSGPLEQKFGRAQKVRLRASPYGFGIDWPDFSAYQLSILAALGISRR